MGGGFLVASVHERHLQVRDTRLVRERRRIAAGYYPSAREVFEDRMKNEGDKP